MSSIVDTEDDKNSVVSQGSRIMGVTRLEQRTVDALGNYFEDL